MTQKSKLRHFLMFKWDGLNYNAIQDDFLPQHLCKTIVNCCLVNKCVSVCVCRYIGALGARVICDNIPGLVNKQRQLCQRHPDLMQSIGEGAKEWIRECQHQFRHHRWNCSTLERDHTVFGRVMLRSQYLCYTLSSSFSNKT